jgi:hypothetical protein
LSEEKKEGGEIKEDKELATEMGMPISWDIILVTLFIPSQGAAAGESGELIYYTKY